MFHILGFIFFIVLIVLLIGFIILWRIVNTFLGFGRRMTGANNPNTQGQQRSTYQRADSQQDSNSTNHTRSQSGASSSNATEKGKVFADDEGEYIEFEEIKD